MKHELKISRLAMVCVLCASAACPALGASSVRSLGGAGTYSSASSATTAKSASAGNNAGGVTAARAGSMRVSSASTKNSVSGSGAAVRAGATTPRLSIGKYLGTGTSISGGSSIKNQAAGATSSSSSNSGSMTPEVAADLDSLDKRVDELNVVLSGKQDALNSKDEFVVVDGGNIYLNVESLAGALQDSLGGQGGSAGDVEITTDANGIKWRQGNGNWETLATWDQLKGADGKDGKDGKDGEGLDPAVLNATVDAAVKAQIPTKLSQFQNDAGYVTQEQLDEAKLGGEANLASYAKTADVNTALNNKADKTAIPSKISQLENDEGYAKTADVNASLAGYATTEALNNKADKSSVSALNTELGKVSDVADGATSAAASAATIASNAKTAADTATATANAAKTAAETAATTASAAKTAADVASAKADAVETGLQAKADKTAIPSKVSQLENDKGYLTEHQSLAGYATTSYVDSKNYVTQDQLDEAKLGGEVDLTSYAKTETVNAELAKKADKDSLPTKVSQLENDEGYLTEHQSLAGYAKTADVNASLADYATTEALNNKADKTAVSALNTELGKVSDVADGAASAAADAATIASNAKTAADTATTTANAAKTAAETAATTASAAKTAADAASAKADAVETGLQAKADKTAIPSKVSQLENDKGYLTEHQSLEGYAKTADVNASLAGYVTQEQLDEAKLGGEVDLTAYAKTADVTSALNNKADKSAIPSKVSQLENDEGYLKQHQSLEGYVNTNGVDTSKNKVLAIYNGEQAWLDIAE